MIHVHYILLMHIHHCGHLRVSGSSDYSFGVTTLTMESHVLLPSSRQCQCHSAWPLCLSGKGSLCDILSRLCTTPRVGVAGMTCRQPFGLRRLSATLSRQRSCHVVLLPFKHSGECQCHSTWLLDVRPGKSRWQTTTLMFG